MVMVCVCHCPHRASVELQLRHKTAEHKLLFETFSSRNRDKDKELK